MYTITTVNDKDFGNYACTATDGKSSIGPFNSSVMKIGQFIKSLIFRIINISFLGLVVAFISVMEKKW